ncbi:hypothetical protein [Polaribacter sargassicola]|uniref:hypothetical protein n=1 Tax=Polaribacter sargassicola TaxID=2836891 RepID=UPI001F2D04BB|nr:hypothetical protein [Polaribacter sp. DS7-9]MCG1035175.1 hypothetical protein [Polaribacter sp. DS7-9]
MKIKTAIFFSFLFVCVVTTPTIISLLDKNQNVSFFLNLNEEDNNENEILKNIKVYQNSYSKIFFSHFTEVVSIHFTSTKYSSLFPKIYTPPPEILR